MEAKILSEESCEWASLEREVRSTPLTVGEFIDDMYTSRDDKPSYVFDWSIPQHCPELLDELLIPKYFAKDLLQQLPQGTLYRESWPSLFIGPRGSRCAMHVDTFGSHFWMALFQGRKRWIIFAPEAAVCLSPSFLHGHDAIFAADEVDYCQLDRYDFELGEGDVVFVPCGSPHIVSNLEDTVAISANYVSRSNLNASLAELRVASMCSSEAGSLAVSLTTLAHDAHSAHTSEAADLCWAQFKAQRTQGLGWV